MHQKNNCLTCAFCCRNSETFHSFPLSVKVESYWDEKAESLTTQQRAKLKKNDDSFVHAEITAATNWQNAYELKLKEKTTKRDAILKDKGTATRMLYELTQPKNYVNPIDGSPTEESLEKLGMSKKPDAPDYAYLNCYKEQWSEDRKRENPMSGSSLANTKCPFYFAYAKMGKRSFNACDQIRVARQSSRRFFITNFLVIIGISLTCFFGLMSFTIHPSPTTVILTQTIPAKINKTPTTQYTQMIKKTTTESHN